METAKNNLKKYTALVIIAVIAVLSGYLRDTVFKTINAILRAWDLDEDYNLPAFLSFLNNYEYNTLVNLKWLLTLLVSILYLIISLFAIKILFNNKKYIKITIFTYLGITFISAIFIFTGMIVENTAEKMYEFARYLMGMAQSPIILMILIPAFKLSEKESNKTSNT